MNPLLAILAAAALFAGFGWLQRRTDGSCAGGSCATPPREGGCGACPQRPDPRESSDESA